MSFNQEVREEIESQKVWDGHSRLDQEEQIKRICLREAFLAAGFMNDPNRKYHLEIVCKTKKKAKETLELLQEFEIPAKMITRGKHYLVYLKDGEEISKFLALIGASKAVLKFEDIRVLKEMKNHINRKVNYETANLNRTIDAALEVIGAIKIIKEYKRFEDLEEGVKELAELRVQNPESSLTELGKMLRHPISKSGVNHRLNKLKELANEIKRGNDEG